MLDNKAIAAINDILRRGETAEVKTGPSGVKVFEIRRKRQYESGTGDRKK